MRALSQSACLQTALRLDCRSTLERTTVAAGTGSVPVELLAPESGELAMALPVADGAPDLSLGTLGGAVSPVHHAASNLAGTENSLPGLGNTAPPGALHLDGVLVPAVGDEVAPAGEDEATVTTLQRGEALGRSVHTSPERVGHFNPHGVVSLLGLLPVEWRPVFSLLITRWLVETSRRTSKQEVLARSLQSASVAPLFCMALMSDFTSPSI